MIKTVIKGKDKKYLASCQKCNSDVEYKGSDISGGTDNVENYIDCPECDETIIHQRYNEVRAVKGA